MKHILLLLLCCCVWRLNAQTAENPAYTEAEALAKSNNCEEALSRYETAISASPSNPKYYVGKANCLNKLKMPGEAILILNQAISVKPDYLPAYQMKAKIYESERNYAEAAEVYLAQIPLEKIPGKKLRTYSSLIRVYILQNALSQAEKYLAEARSINPDDLEVLYAEGEVLRAKKDFIQAIGFYEKAILNLGKTSPADAARFYFGLGDAYNKSGDRDNAIKAWQKARFGPYKKTVEAELMKSNPDFYLKLGISYFLASEYDEAQKQLNRAIEIQNDHAQAHRYLGMIADKRDQTAEAEKYFVKAIQYEMVPDKKIEIEIAYLNMLMDNELYLKAIPVATNILVEKPDQVKVMLQKAQAELNTGKYSVAVKTCQKALTMPALTDAGKKAPYYFVLGMSLKASGDLDGALEAFKQVTLGPCKNAAQNEMEMLQPEVY